MGTKFYCPNTYANEHKMNEEWRPVNITGCEKYSISSMSNIKNENGHVMKPTKQGNITLCGSLGKVRKYVHEVSCVTFHGPKPSPTHTVDQKLP